MTTVQRTPAAKQVHITATAIKVNGIKLKNRDGTDRCLPQTKYSSEVYKLLSPKQNKWLWQDHKKAKSNGEDIPAAKKRCSKPLNKLNQWWLPRNNRSAVSLLRTKR